MTTKKTKYDAIFFSPHLDDAVLSCGNLINQMTQKKKKVLIATFFTSPGPNKNKITIDAKSFVKKSGYSSPQKLFIKRKSEDRDAAKYLNSDFAHLDMVDASFRKDKNNCEIYPSFKKVFSGEISSSDSANEKKLKKNISEIIKDNSNSNTKLYSPLGIGGHVDHVLIFNEINKLISNKIFFWEDVPYRNHPEQLYKRLAHIQTKNNNSYFKKKVIFSKIGKKTAIEKYSSQVNGLKENGLCSFDYHHDVLYSVRQKK